MAELARKDAAVRDTAIEKLWRLRAQAWRALASSKDSPNADVARASRDLLGMLANDRYVGMTWKGAILAETCTREGLAHEAIFARLFDLGPAHRGDAYRWDRDAYRALIRKALEADDFDNAQELLADAGRYACIPTDYVALLEARVCLDAMPAREGPVLQIVPALDRAGRKRDADGLFDLMFARLAKNADAMGAAQLANAAAWAAALCGRQLDKALGYARKACELDPKSTDFLDTLAEVHFRAGRTKDAIDIMARCVQMEPKRAYFQRQLERCRKGDVTAPLPADDGLSPSQSQPASSQVNP
ncbi:MAG: hypothetical protein ACE15C_07300 [Phycisphaerae bacterium]